MNLELIFSVNCFFSVNIILPWSHIDSAQGKERRSVHECLITRLLFAKVAIVDR